MLWRRQVIRCLRFSQSEIVQGVTIACMEQLGAPYLLLVAPGMSQQGSGVGSCRKGPTRRRIRRGRGAYSMTRAARNRQDVTLQGAPSSGLIRGVQSAIFLQRKEMLSVAGKYTKESPVFLSVSRSYLPDSTSLSAMPFFPLDGGLCLRLVSSRALKILPCSRNTSRHKVLFCLQANSPPCVCLATAGYNREIASPPDTL